MKRHIRPQSKMRRLPLKAESDQSATFKEHLGDQVICWFLVAFYNDDYCKDFSS